MLNTAQLSSSADSAKLDNLRKVQEIIVNREPDLLDNFLDEATNTIEKNGVDEGGAAEGGTRRGRGPSRGAVGPAPPSRVGRVGEP